LTAEAKGPRETATVTVLADQHLASPDCIHLFIYEGVHNDRIEAGIHRHVEEADVEQGP